MVLAGLGHSARRGRRRRHHRRREHRPPAQAHRAAGDRLPAIRVVLEASLEVRSSVVFASVIVVLVFLPVFPSRGPRRGILPAAGDELRTRGPGVAAGRAHGDSGVSLILLPRSRLELRDPALLRFLKRAYRAFLPGVVERPWLSAGFLVVIFAATAIAFPFLAKNSCRSSRNTIS